MTSQLEVNDLSAALLVDPSTRLSLFHGSALRTHRSLEANPQNQLFSGTPFLAPLSRVRSRDHLLDHILDGLHCRQRDALLWVAPPLLGHSQDHVDSTSLLDSADVSHGSSRYCFSHLNWTYSVLLGPIGRFLSWKGWIPVSRLTYCLYLVHLIPIVVSAYSVQYVLPFDDFYNVSPLFLRSFC